MYHKRNLLRDGEIKKTKKANSSFIFQCKWKKSVLTYFHIVQNLTGFAPKWIPSTLRRYVCATNSCENYTKTACFSTYKKVCQIELKSFVKFVAKLQNDITSPQRQWFYDRNEKFRQQRRRIASEKDKFV